MSPQSLLEREVLMELARARQCELHRTPLGQQAIDGPPRCAWLAERFAVLGSAPPPVPGSVAA